MKEKQLLRSYRFRDYLKVIRVKRQLYKVLPIDVKANILRGFRDWIA